MIRPRFSPWSRLFLVGLIAIGVLALTVTLAAAAPVNDHRVKAGCHGKDNFVWHQTAYRMFFVKNNGTVDCPVDPQLFDTNDLPTVDEKIPQTEVASAPKEILKAGASKIFVTSEYDPNCKLQIDIVVGWEGPVLKSLLRGAEYDTNMLASNDVYGGEGRTNDGTIDCKPEVTPTPISSPSPTPTQTTPPPETRTVEPSSTPTPKASVSPTPSPSPTAPSTKTPPTEVPPTKGTQPSPTPVAPSTGSTLSNGEKTSLAGVGLMVAAIGITFLFGRMSKTR